MKTIAQRCLALILCSVLALGCCMTALAEGEDSEYCHIHVWKPIKVTKQVCNYEGCGAYFDTAEEVGTHILVAHDGCATYSSKKITIGWQCAYCGMETTNTDPADNPLGTEHTWDNGRVTKEPTETEEGSITYTCTVCSATKTEAIPARSSEDFCHLHAWQPIKETKQVCNYEGCGAYFDTTQEVATHILVVHDGAATYSSKKITLGWKCARCGMETTNTDPAQNPLIAEHSWGEGQVTTEPTCTQEGMKTYTCAGCGKTRTETIPATGHTAVAYPAVAATCTTEGHAAGTQCSVCGAILSGGEATPALGHSYDEGKITQQPTCEEEGVKTYTCTNCGDTKTEAVPATGHSWDEGKVTKDPTCEEEGVKTYTCTDCGETKTEAVPALGHSYDEGVITQQPTCTVDGEITYTCERCGATLKDPVDATGHSFGPWETLESPSCTDAGSEQRTCTACGYKETRNLDATGHIWETDYTVDKPATCTSDGSQSIHCANCSATKDAQVIPATGHNWDEGQVTQAATCTQPGVMTYHCTVCGATKTEPIPATGHSYDQGAVTQEPTCTEPGVMTYTCAACGATYTQAIDALGHDYDAGVITQQPTCTEDGVITYTCERCGATLKDPVDAQGHSWNEGQVTTEPTCTAEGVKTYTCTACGATKTEAVPAAGHNYGDRWYSDDNGHWQVCSVCGQATDPAEHTLQWLTDQAPTATEPGSCHEECTVCGYQGETKAIPATGTSGGNTGDTGTGENTSAGTTTETGSTQSDKTSPKTGDESQVILWAAALTLSLGALGGILVYSKKRRA